MTASDETTAAEMTPRQQAVLAYIRETVRGRGYPPSVREICEGVGLKSTSSAHSVLGALERAGYLRRDPLRPRAIEVLVPPDELAPAATADERPRESRSIPLVGEIAAGAPILAEERVEQHLELPKELTGEGTLFMLRVRGESMIEAGVMPDDLVVVRQQPTVEQGEMCAALVEDEATVKFFRRTRSGEVFLDPANEDFEPIPVTSDQDAAILGKVTAVLRSL